MLDYVRVQRKRYGAINNGLITIAMSISSSNATRSYRVDNSFFVRSISSTRSRTLLHSLRRTLVDSSSLQSMLSTRPDYRVVNASRITVGATCDQTMDDGLPPLIKTPTRQIKIIDPSTPGAPTSVGARAGRPSGDSRCQRH